jgi:hypothetical protein
MQESVRPRPVPTPPTLNGTRRIVRIGGRLRVRAGAEVPRRAADRWLLGSEPGRRRGGAAPFGHTPAPAVLAGGDGRGTGPVSTCCLGLNTPPTAVVPAPGPASQAARAVPGAPQWRVPHRVPSRTPAPAWGLHSGPRRRHPASVFRKRQKLVSKMDSIGRKATRYPAGTDFPEGETRPGTRPAQVPAHHHF